MNVCHICGKDNTMKDGGWLDKYNDGGPVQPNYNDYSVSAPEGFEGDGYSNVGRNYSPAWGGQFQDGGQLITNRKDFSPGILSNVPGLSSLASGNQPGYNRHEQYGPLGDLYRYYGGLPLEHNVLMDSQYKPAKSKDKNAKYISLNRDPSFVNEVLDNYKRVSSGKLDKGESKLGDDNWQVSGYSSAGKDAHKTTKQGSEHHSNAIGRYTLGKGKDKKGEYISYYDKFDQGTGLGINPGELLGLTKPFEIYDRIYLDPKTGKPKMAMGGSMPGAVGFTYARTGDIPSNGPYAKKTMASAQNGTWLDKAINKAYESEDKLSEQLGNPMKKATNIAKEASYKHLGSMDDPIDSYRHSMAGNYTSEAIQDKLYNIPLVSQAAGFVGANLLGAGHELSTLIGHAPEFGGDDDRPWLDKIKESGEDVFNNMVGAGVGSIPFMSAKQKSDLLLNMSLNNRLPDGHGQGNMYIKKKQNGGEMKYYQEGLDFQPKTISRNGSVIKDDMGQWNHPGEITEIGSNQITMQGVPYPVMGISDTGDMQMMYPNQDYNYDGSSVTEYPMMADGGILDSIVNVGKGAVNYVDNLIKTGINKLSAMDKPDPNIAIAAAEVESRRMKEKFLKEREALYPKSAYDKLFDLSQNHPKMAKFNKQLDRTEWNSDGYDIGYATDENRIKLSTGRFTNANVSTKLIDDLAEAAKRNNMPIGQLLTLAGRESTFGEEKGKNFAYDDKNIYTSGWDVANDYKPYDVHRFLADKKVPGVKVIKSSRGYTYDFSDREKAEKYMNSHPELLEQYKKKLDSTPDIGNRNFFDLSAEFLKKKGIQGYNPGDPRYVQMFQKDYNTLKQDKALMAYLKKKGYKYEDGGELTKLDQLTNFTNYNTKQPGGWLDKYSN
jgi:hypothetical protein